MKTMFLYLLRTRRGILTTLGWSCGLLFFSAMIVGFCTGMRFWIYSFLERLSILAVVIAFPFVCSHAFRYGTANGVSRSTVIKTVLAAVLFVSAMQSALNAGILFLRRLYTMHDTSAEYHWSYDMLYINFTSSVQAEQTAAKEMLDAVSLKLICWESMLYFGIVCLLLTVCCYLYALYRKYGIPGPAGGVIVPFLVFWTVQMVIESSDRKRERVHAFFYHQEPVQLTQFGMNIIPKAAPWTAVFVILILAAAAAFALCMKHTDIRKVNG